MFLNPYMQYLHVILESNIYSHSIIFTCLISSENAVMIKVVKSHKSRLSSGPSLFQIMKRNVSVLDIVHSQTHPLTVNTTLPVSVIYSLELAQYAYPVQTECCLTEEHFLVFGKTVKYYKVILLHVKLFIWTRHCSLYTCGITTLIKVSLFLCI